MTGALAARGLTEGFTLDWRHEQAVPAAPKASWHAIRRGRQCPLLAQDGHGQRHLTTSAIGGKADIRGNGSTDACL